MIKSMEEKKRMGHTKQSLSHSDGEILLGLGRVWFSSLKDLSFSSSNFLPQ